MQENVSNGSVPVPEAYLQSLINVIEVDNTQILHQGQQGIAGKGSAGEQICAKPVFADED